MFTDCRGTLQSIDCDMDVKQVLISKNYKGTLKGLHKSPYRKKVYVASGKIYDFFSDGEEVVEKVLTQGECVYVPENWWHGYHCLEDSEVIYFLGGKYDPTTDAKAFWRSPEFKFKYEFDKAHLIISDSDNDSKWAKQYKYIVIGDGFLGNQFKKYFPDSFILKNRLDDPDLIESINKSGCEAVICAAGIRGKPNIDWCETHEYETFKTNFLDTISFFERCKKPIVYFGSGMVYKYEGVYKEDDEVQHDGKKYSKWRIRLEEVLEWYPHVTYLRIMYPVSLDGDQRCFYEKMKTRFAHDIRVPITVIPELFPQIPKLIGKGGIFNFVNEGTISLSWLSKLGTIEGCSRGFYELDTTKIKECGLNVSNVQASRVLWPG